MSATSTILDRYMFKRPGSAMWQLRKPVPTDVRTAFGRAVVTKSLGTSNDREATKAAVAILDTLDEQWDAIRRDLLPVSVERAPTVSASGEPPDHIKQSIIRTVFEHVVAKVETLDNARFNDAPTEHLGSAEKRRASARSLNREVRMGKLDRFEALTEKMLTNRSLTIDRRALWFQLMVRDVATAVLDARDVGLRADEGALDPQPTTNVVKAALGHREIEPPSKDIPFSELADQFMKQWLAGRSGGKVTNTEQQKRATFRLFGGFSEDRPIRKVRHEDAAKFFDTVRLLDPSWARSPAARKLNWSQLIECHGDRDRSLSDGTMNRHLQVLQELWNWSKKRGHCEGDNPFDGFHKKLRPGLNVTPYVAWEDADLRRLFTPPPKRSDLLEVMIVGLFTGMRLDEIASLTWGQVRSVTEGGIEFHYFQVEDAKTPAGNRTVPVHRSLGWLLERDRGEDRERIWPTFNEEGRGKKPGADAGREFSRFKMSRGFSDRSKAFHSFRKNVTRMMERAGVPENDWAQIFGHERGFTYTVYNPDGINMRQRAAIIDIISYGGIHIPHPVS